MRRIITGAAAVLVAAGGVFGQCNVQRHNVPDFDQKRDPLPGDGGMYCVPTSAVNWMAYISNYGWPMMMLQTGPVNWQSQIAFNFVTNQIDFMGDLMNTSPTEGTTGGNGRNGLAAFMLTRSFGRFTVTRYTGEISPGFLYLQVASGGLVNVCYGYYKPVAVNPNRFYRDGGHCVTLNAVYGACSGNPRIRYRDPGSDSTLASQSTFASFITRMSRQTFTASDGTPLSRWRLLDLGVGSTTRRYLDSAYVIRPLIALTASATRANELVTLRPVRFEGSDLPESSGVPIPNDTAITGVAMHPVATTALVTTSGGALVPTRYTWRYNVASGEFEQLFTCLSATPAVFNRFGEAYIACDGSVRHYRLPEAGGSEQIGSIAPASPLQALAYDDARDELVGLSRTSGRLIRYSRNLGNPIDQPLPGAVQPVGDISLAINEEQQRYFIAGSGGASVWELRVDAASGRLVLVAQFVLPGEFGPRSLQFNDAGHLLAVDGDGSVREFAPVIGAGWQPVADSLFAGMGSGGAFVVARSRSDFEPGVHDTIEWADVVVDEDNEERPDCLSDWDTDGVVNSGDISAFLTGWLASVAAANTAADFNDDGVTNSGDISSFLTAWLTDVTQGCW